MLQQTLIQICKTAKLAGLPETHKDFLTLSEDIADTLGENVSCSTLKRIFGKVKSTSTPSMSVLNILGRYLGYSDWHSYQDYLYNGVSELIDFSIKDDGSCEYLCPDNLRIGAILEIKYEPECVARLHYIGNNLFRVLSITDSKLLVGDILDIRSFQVGSAIMGGNIIRNGESIGVGFRLASIKGGICNLRIMQS
ncbi:MAG: hypothetical protein IKK27_09785 [Alistipes sp.]|nr:hypothetical protein [Alistipes sp.]